MSAAMSMEEMNAVVARRAEPSFDAFAMADRVSRSPGGRSAEAAAALASGRAMLQKGDHYEARRLLRRACVLESARGGGRYWTSPSFGREIETAWADLQKRHEEAARTRLPALARKADLVARNMELADALGALEKASGVELHIEPGSLEDAAAAQRRAGLGIAFLDLRGATLAQALTCLVDPGGLEWHVDAGTVVVTSSRRRPGRSVWVYDVPGPAPRGPDDIRKREEELRGAAGAEAVVLDSEHVLVDGDAGAHVRAAAALGRLSDDALRREAARRADPRRAAAALRDFSWTLLAASLRGETDDQAVSELREAWRTPGLAEAIAAESLTLAARTAWVIARARSVAPGHPELASLADEALGVLRAALARRSAAPRKADEAAGGVFLALLRSEPRLPSTLVPLLPAAEAVCAVPMPPA